MWDHYLVHDRPLLPFLFMCCSCLLMVYNLVNNLCKLFINPLKGSLILKWYPISTYTLNRFCSIFSFIFLPNTAFQSYTSSWVSSLPLLCTSLLIICVSALSYRHVWEKGGLAIDVKSSPRLRVDPNGTLHISQTWSGDIGTYTCRVTSVGGNDSRSAYLRVRSDPTPSSSFLSIPATAGPTFTPSHTLSAVVIFTFCLFALWILYAPWTVLLANIEPEATSIAVGGLIPARSYQFRLCAVNDVGKGQFSRETERLTLPEEPPSAPPQTVIASGRTNQSIMIQWQPPPESHQNGPLQGYIIRYCLSGLPVDCQIKNITNPDQTNLLLEDLIIWTNYEIEVAAYNGAGQGVFSQKVTEWTLQGVPTVPPGNAQAEAVNSTTVRFTWSAPSPQFINGINQGYKVSAFLLLSSVQSGHLSFRSDFSSSVILFVHLSFYILSSNYSDCLQPPSEEQINGILLGFRVRYRELHYDRLRSFTVRTVNSPAANWAELTGESKFNPPPHPRAAVRRAHSGLSLISMSVPVSAEMPGPPTNIAISNIGPRSVALQFKPGYDGKTSISRWAVEAQIGVIGENEEWVTVHQLSNEPDARSLVVEGLNPYTFYRFRMRQVNIVGTSPSSQPSRKIQTLQAPPDIAPANVTLRTASETSLWLRWVPLPEWEYNGNPELVGYRVQYSRVGSKGGVLNHVISDRLEREFTIEDLEEWTEYEVHVQAINGIGSGPWSQPVHARTRESVPSSGPANVSAFATTSSSILVRWGEVPEPDRNGLILGYKVVYREKDSDSVLRFWTVEGNTSHSVQLTGLDKYVLYEIQVLSFTRIGDGAPSSFPILERTLDDVPGPPVGILFPEVRTNSVRLIWQPPAQPNGIILAYQITYRRNSSNSNSATVDVLSPSARQYTATGLKAESVYVFRLTAQTRKGWGEAAEALVVTTEKRERNRHSVLSCPLILQWLPCSVSFTDSSPHTPGVSKVVTVDVKGSAPLWMKIKDLADGVTYNFRIRAKTLTYGPEVEANITTGPGEGEPFISRYGTALTLHWTSGDPGRSPITRYVIEARPSDEGLWDILIKDIPKEVTSYTLNLDMLREGVTYDFRVIAVNDYGYGSPSLPSFAFPAQKVSPFYEEWWFLVVIALVGLIFILLLIFILIIRGQSKKYTKKTDSGISGILKCQHIPLAPTLLNLLFYSNLSLLCIFFSPCCRSPPRPSPGSLHYSDEDVSAKCNDLIPAESSSLTEKPSEVSDSQGSDSEYEMDPNRQKTHSFVNHYISDPTYYNSWRRQQKGVSRPPAYGYGQPDGVAEPESRPHPPPLPPLPPLLPHTAPSPQPQGQGTLFRPKGSRTPTPSLLSSDTHSQHTLYRPPSSLGASTQTPATGFSSFV
uniref:Sidekick cell adhesion molecule 2a n=1 Tax=Astyanax mexicanus TaxID=7994 RepID=A0A8B9GTL9_ASTMX